MAITINGPTYPAQPPGNNRLAIANFTGDNSYPTGGYTVALSAWGFSNYMQHSEPSLTISGTTYYLVKYNLSTGKLMFFTASNSGIIEVTNGTDLHTFTVNITAFGV